MLPVNASKSSVRPWHTTPGIFRVRLDRASCSRRSPESLPYPHTTRPSWTNHPFWIDIMASDRALSRHSQFSSRVSQFADSNAFGQLISPRGRSGQTVGCVVWEDQERLAFPGSIDVAGIICEILADEAMLLSPSILLSTSCTSSRLTRAEMLQSAFKHLPIASKVGLIRSAGCSGSALLGGKMWPEAGCPPPMGTHSWLSWNPAPWTRLEGGAECFRRAMPRQSSPIGGATITGSVSTSIRTIWSTYPFRSPPVFSIQSVTLVFDAPVRKRILSGSAPQ